MKNLTKAKLFSIVRHSLSAVGGVLVARGIVNSSIVTDISGVVLSITALIWSIKEKSTTVSMIEGVIRQVITALGGFLAFISPGKATQITGALLTILPAILGLIKDVTSEEEEAVDPTTPIKF